MELLFHVGKEGRDVRQIHGLSLRLQAIAREVPMSSRLADIGTDHAELPVALMSNGHILSAVASDAKAGPFQAALRTVAAAGLSESISVRHGEGLETLEQSENIDVITIAGMGGRLITKILADGEKKLAPVKRLVLQPNVAADTVRKWLYDTGWLLISEHIVQEGRFYEVLTAVKDENGAQSAYKYKNWDDAILFGPKLLEKKSEAFQLKWTEELNHLERVLKQMDGALGRSQIAEERERIKKRIEKIREVLT